MPKTSLQLKLAVPAATAKPLAKAAAPVFRAMMLFCTVCAPPLTYTPPPPAEVPELATMVLPSRVTWVLFWQARPPPKSSAELPDSTELPRVAAGQDSNMPPPPAWASLPLTVRLSRVAVTPLR